MIHGSTSFNFCWSTNVEHCCDLLKHCCTCWILIDQQLHILARSWNSGRGIVAVALCFKRCCRYYEAPTKKDVRNNRKIWTREWLRNRAIFKARTTLCLGNSETSSFAAISTRALSLVSRFLWSFDLPWYRHGKVSYRLISWLVLSKLQSNSAVSNSSATMLKHVTPNSKTIGWSRLTSGNLLNGIEPCSIFGQQRSTTFNMLNVIFQQSTSHTRFNICWTFVEQQLQHLLFNKCWTVYHSL